MRRILAACALVLAVGSSASASGMLIPVEKKLPPLAMVNHKVTITIDDQVATTRIEQTFRNHTDRPLEATYLFPVPKGASVRKFTMWVDGKEIPASWSRPRKPARSTPTSSAAPRTPACSST